EGVAQLFAELADVDVDGALVAVPAGAPHAVEELTPGQRDAGVLDEVLEQVELASRQRHHVPVDGGLAAGGVDVDAADGELGGRFPLGAVAAPQDRFDPGDQLPRGERLGDI